jgi:hypothetical protein
MVTAPWASSVNVVSSEASKLIELELPPTKLVRPSQSLTSYCRAVAEATAAVLAINGNCVALLAAVTEANGMDVPARDVTVTVVVVPGVPLTIATFVAASTEEAALTTV